MILLGLDPGLQSTGWGVIEAEGSRLRHIANGQVKSRAADALSDRLAQIYEGLAKVIAEHRPLAVAVEETFVNANPQSTLKLGQARGVAMLAGARAGLPVAEYAPTYVKKAVVGTGGADKEQIRAMVKRLLPGVTITGPDAADALAIAITHAHVAASKRGLRMIARLSGRLVSAGMESAVIDVNGVGYLVSASSKTLNGLGRPGDPVVVHVETHVREDAIQLFGFLTEDERDWFRLLQTVQGVGGRVALAILSVLPPFDLQPAIALGDTASVARANGVGPKLAARIVNELKDKAGTITVSGAPQPVTAPTSTAAKDALSAMGNLGFRPAEAARAIAEAQAELGDDAPFSDLLRTALKKSAK